jgi:hypothetical protein
MVINSININKTKERLNSDGHQFHQYQQNEQSLLILTEHTEHRSYHVIWRWNPDPGLGQSQQGSGVKLVNGLPTQSSW